MDIAWIALIVGAVLGGFVGSFLGVVVHRLPGGRSIVTPPSHCDDCGTVLTLRDNIPLIGWPSLRGRCRHCGAGIPISVWLIELLTAAGTGALCWWAFSDPARVVSPLAHGLVTAGAGPWAVAIGLGALLVVWWALVVSTLTDLAHLIIPDELSKPLQLVGPVLALCTLAGAADQAVMNGLAGWFVAETRIAGMTVSNWAVGAGFTRLLLLVLGAGLLLLVSLPVARWCYGSWIRDPFPWRDEDHRAFAKGGIWFAACLGLWLVVAGVLAALADPLDGAPGWALFALIMLSHSLLGMVVGWWLPYLVGLVGSMALRRNAMGYGDVKLLAWMGALLGPIGIVYTFFIAAVYGTIVGVPARLMGGGHEIPFGPWLVLGGITALVLGPNITTWVLGALG